jgi:cytochrome P450
MLYTEGESWKRTRALFNPGFAMGHLMTLVPSIVNDTLIFRQILDGYAASGEIFSMERAAARLTVDIMGHIVLDHDLNSQTTDNDLMNLFERAVKWTPSGSTINPLYKLNFVRPIIQWYLERRMDQYIMKVLEDRYKSREYPNGSTKRGRKPAIDLALDAFVAEERDEMRPRNDDRLDMGIFNQFVIDQMKTFMFAGHDTTGSTISYIYYLLDKHPESLAKVREEHDEVFGKDITVTADLIRENPSLINKHVYTTAVIKG